MTPPEITHNELEKFKKLLTDLSKFTTGGITPFIEKQLLYILDSSIPFISNLILTHRFDEVNRLTINKRVVGENKRISDIKFLKYPPKDKVLKYGRCNYPNQSILYSSFLSFTAMNESQPRTGDLVTKTKWRVRNEQSLKYCPIFKNQPTRDNLFNPRTHEIEEEYEKAIQIYPPLLREQIDLLVQFMADAFTRRINPSNHLDYLFSAYFSNKLFNELEDGEIEAIYYPSVKDGLTFENLAIKPDVFDTKYDLVEVKDSVCFVDPTDGNKAYLFDGLCECKDFDLATGKVLWEKGRVQQPQDRLLWLQKTYGIDLEPS